MLRILNLCLLCLFSEAYALVAAANEHRYLYLLFYREEDKPPPVFHATVDMTTQRVVSAGPVQRSDK